MKTVDPGLFVVGQSIKYCVEIGMKYFGQGNEFTNFDVVGTCFYLRVNATGGWKIPKL